MEQYQDRARGMLVGLAVGDALGATYEFGFSSERIRHLGDKISTFQESVAYPAGAWTDDTSMALCIADSLLEKHGYNSYDIMYKFSLWMNEGYRAFDDQPALDVGQQTATAINNYLAEPTIRKDAKKTESAGNGPIMRLAPIVIANTFPNQNLDKTIKESELGPLIDMAILSCRETHNSIAAECVTEIFATVLYSAIRGYEKKDIKHWHEKWNPHDNEYSHFWQKNTKYLIDRAFQDGEDLRDLGGYIVDAFAIALWSFIHSESFEDGMLKVIRLGGDTDTNAACYGQLAGAYYGYKAIPEKWRSKVCKAKELVKLADDLLAMESCPILKTRFEDDEHFERIR